MKFINVLKLFFAVLFMVFIFCSCGEKTEEEIILDTIKMAGQSVVDNNSDGIMSFVSPDYLDSQGRNYDDIESIIKQYTGRFTGIVVNILKAKIVNLSTLHAELDIEIYLSSGFAKMIRKMISISGRLYRFRIKMIKTKNFWEITGVVWQPVVRGQLLPGSKKMLRKLL